MKKTLSQRFVWANMAKDAAKWMRTCLPCQKSKIHRHQKNMPEHIPVPKERFNL